jgi:hypothetical protein
MVQSLPESCSSTRQLSWQVERSSGAPTEPKPWPPQEAPSPASQKTADASATVLFIGHNSNTAVGDLLGSIQSGQAPVRAGGHHTASIISQVTRAPFCLGLSTGGSCMLWSDMTPGPNGAT